MSLIGKKIEEFNAHAYHQGEFLEVSEKDLMGTGVFFASIQLILLLFVLLN